MQSSFVQLIFTQWFLCALCQQLATQRLKKTEVGSCILSVSQQNCKWAGAGGHVEKKVRFIPFESNTRRSSATLTCLRLFNLLESQVEIPGRISFSVPATLPHHSIIFFNFQKELKFPGKALTSQFNRIYRRLIPDLSQESLDLCRLSYSIRTWVRYMRNAVLRPGLWFFCVLGWLKFPLWAYLLTVMSSHDLTANESLPMCLDHLQCHLVVVQIILVLGVNGWQPPSQ